MAMNYLSGREFLCLLIEKGIVAEGVQRVVIDVPMDDIVRIYSSEIVVSALVDITVLTKLERGKVIDLGATKE